MNVLEIIKENEGFEGGMYKCPAKKLTIGYGFNLEAIEMPRHVADLWLLHIVKKTEKALDDYYFFRKLNEPRKAVILDMAYQMGIFGVSKFRDMISAINADKYELAAKEMLNSRYARQTPNRAKRNAEIMKTGVFK